MMVIVNDSYEQSKYQLSWVIMLWETSWCSIAMFGSICQERHYTMSEKASMVYSNQSTCETLPGIPITVYSNDRASETFALFIKNEPLGHS